MKIFITGHRGQLGRALIKELNYFPITSEDNILDKVKMDNFIRLSKPDIIINCAAYTKVEMAESDVENWKVNAYGPAALSELAARHSVKFIQISSDYVYGEDTAEDIHCTFPMNSYGMAKMLGDMAVYKASNRNLIIRVQNLCSETKGVIFIFLNVKSGHSVGIYDVKIGPTSVYLLAKDIIKMINKIGIYNYAPIDTVNVVDLYKYISKDNLYKIVNDETKAKRKSDNTMRLDKISREIQLRPWQEHVDDILWRINGA